MSKHFLSWPRLMIGMAFVTLMSNAGFAMENMAGKTIEWTIPFSEKGGSAKWANFFAPLLSETTDATVVVMFRPGAGSTKGANWFQKQKEDDGTVLFGTSASTQFPYLLGDPRVKYEYKDWIPVMATGTGGVAYLNKELGEKFDGSANNLKGVNFIFGSQGATRLDLVALLAWKMLGLNVKPIFGIKGRGDGRLMFERGEANIDYQTSASYLKAVTPLVKAGTAVPMMSWGSLNDKGNIIRNPTFPDIPTFKEICEATEGCQTSGDVWEAWKAFFTAGFPVQKIAFLPQGTPQGVAETFVKAFGEIKGRKDFAEISEKRLGKYPMFVGNEAQAALERAILVPEKAKNFVKNWLKEDYGVELM